MAMGYHVQKRPCAEGLSATQEHHKIDYACVKGFDRSTPQAINTEVPPTPPHQEEAAARARAHTSPILDQKIKVPLSRTQSCSR